MSLYEKLKQIKWLEYYVLGPQNKNWSETWRNPFYGIKQALGVKNIDPHTVVDLRMFYVPMEYIPIPPPIGSKKTLGEPWVRWMIGRWVIFELRKNHPPCGLYINGGITFSFNLTKKWFPWVALNIRPCHKHYLNTGVGWEGTAENDKTVAELGLKFRIANYNTEAKWNPGCVAPKHLEGHI